MVIMEVRSNKLCLNSGVSKIESEKMPLRIGVKLVNDKDSWEKTNQNQDN